MGQARGLQVRLDPCLSAPPVDRGIGRRFAGDLHNVRHALPDSAVDDRDLLARHGRTHQNDGVDAVQGRVQRVRSIEIIGDDLDLVGEINAVRHAGRVTDQRPMLHAGHTVEAAARRSGFGSADTLRRVFATRLGLTPSAYRDQAAAHEG